MYIFIKNTAFAKAVHGVTLKDGYLPVIPFSYKKVAALPENIELAIWFKVLVLDFIIIDCNDRSIQFNIRGSNIHDKHRTGPDGFISTRQNPDEIDLECFFASLLKQLKYQAKGEISNDDFFSALLRLLHCYVLPLITFQQKHIPAIEKAYAEEKTAINILDQEIDKLSAKLYDLQNSYHRLIYNFIPSLSNEETGFHLYSKEFLIKINISIGKLLREIRTDLDISQDSVESAKLKGDLEEIKHNRQKRNSCCLKLVQLTAARENILEHLEGKRKKGFRGCFGVDHSVLEEVKNFKKIEKEIAVLTNALLDSGRQKVLATSVKEAIRCSIEDLKDGGEYVGLETDKSGSRPTDVLDILVSSNDWLTLKEQIATILKTSNHSLTKFHQEFCLIFKNKCVVSEYEHRVFQPWDTLHKIFKSSTGLSDSASSSSEGSCNVNISEDINVDPQFIAKSPKESESIKMRPICRKWSLSKRKGLVSVSKEITSIAPELPPCHNPCELKPDQELVALRNQRQHSGSRRITEDDFVFVNTFTLTQLKEYLHCHMMEMCARLQKMETKDDTQVSLPSLWICYEWHIFSEIFPSLINLYKAVYQVQCQKLKRNLKVITWEHLNVDEKFLQKFSVINCEFDGQLEDLSQYSPVYSYHFRHCFANIIKIIKSITKTTSIISLCKMLSSTLRLISQKISNNLACADDLIIVLTLILLHCEPSLVAQLYIILNLLMNLLPDFLEKGIYGYTLATYLMVYQFFFSNFNQ